MLIRMVFLDLGGTLVEIKPQIYADSAREISAVGERAIDSDDLRRAIDDEWRHRNGEDIAWVKTEKLEQQYWQAFYRDVLQRLGVNSPPQQLLDLLSQRAADPHSFMCFGDVVGVLEALQQDGIGLGLISNAFPSARCILDCLHLTHWFNPLVLSYEHPWAKPDRRIYEHALERANTLPEQALFVDDRPKFVSGANEVRMNTLLIDREGGCQNTKEKIYDLRELLVVL